MTSSAPACDNGTSLSESGPPWALRRLFVTLPLSSEQTTIVTSPSPAYEQDPTSLQVCKEVVEGPL